MLDISTLLINVSAFFEALLRTSAPARKASKKAETLTKSELMSNVACEIHLII